MAVVNQPNYTVKAAAVRAGKSTRTIERWIRDGMKCRNVAGVVVIDHPDLLAQLRARAIANPNRPRHAEEVAEQMSRTVSV
jgi:hypothetical protein